MTATLKNSTVITGNTLSNARTNIGKQIAGLVGYSGLTWSPVGSLALYAGLGLGWPDPDLDLRLTELFFGL